MVGGGYKDVCLFGVFVFLERIVVCSDTRWLSGRSISVF